ncbi:hypothetical protein MMC68H_00355 [Mycoplasma mycoides subsp. capri]|nr:hypothetical protein MMC68H_00355 [Mycoplasma mycoides subsp. capri]
MIGSTAAVAIACEGKPLSVVVSKGETKAQKQELSEESSDENKSAAQPNNGIKLNLKFQMQAKNLKMLSKN